MNSAPLFSLKLTAAYGGKTVLRDVALHLAAGEVLGLVGQSGCGKSTLALAILKLLHLKNGRAEGSIMLNGRDLVPLKEREMRALRGRDIGLVLQSPIASLNPALRIAVQLEEAWKVHCRGSRDQRHEAVAQALRSVSLPAEEQFLRRYPAQLSVGQAQRVLIAMATMHRPALLIADEPTSALDLITQAEILQLFAQLSRTMGSGILYISHDLLSVASIAHRIAVMQAGEIVECRSTQDIFRDPQHPYTRQLIQALPANPASAARAAAAK